MISGLTPNPTHSHSTLNVRVPRGDQITLQVFDLAGMKSMSNPKRRVRTALQPSHASSSPPDIGMPYPATSSQSRETLRWIVRHWRLTRSLNRLALLPFHL